MGGTRLGSPFSAPLQRRASGASRRDATRTLRAAIAAEIRGWESGSLGGRATLKTLVELYIEQAPGKGAGVLNEVLDEPVMLTPLGRVDKRVFESLEAALGRLQVDRTQVLTEMRRMARWATRKQIFMRNILAGYRPLKIRAGVVGVGCVLRYPRSRSESRGAPGHRRNGRGRSSVPAALWRTQATKCRPACVA